MSLEEGHVSGENSSESSQTKLLEGSEERGTSELGGRLAGLSLGRQVFALALWPFLEQVLAFVTGATDLVLAGRMGTEAEVAPLLEALAIAGYVGWLVFIVQGAISTGATALISRATGARDPRLANRVLAQAGLLSVILGAAFGLVLALSAEFLAAGIFGLEAAAVRAAVDYLHVFAISAPFSGIVLCLNASLRGAGDTVTPFRVMVVVNVLNVILSVTFSFWLNMGVTGLALGTVIGWAAGAALVIFLLQRKTQGEDVVGELMFKLRRLKPDCALSWRVLRIGLPTALEIGGLWAIQVAIGRHIASLPMEGALGAHMMAIRLESMSFLPGFAVGAAAATLAGQYLGAGNPERAKEAVAYCWRVGLILMSALGLSLIIFAEGWARLIAPDAPELVEMAVPLIRIGGAIQLPMATAIILATALRGAGATRTVLVWGLGSQFFWRVCVMWLLIETVGLSMVQVWLIVSLDMCWRGAVFSWLFKRGAWLNQKV